MSDIATPQRVLCANASDGIGDLVGTLFPKRRLLLVCDEFTWTAAGQKIHAKLSEIKPTRCSLGKYISAELRHTKTIIESANDADILVAIGAGTINDLTKYAATALDKPYLCIPTAASMNGYTSANASLEDGGHKQSFRARPPVAVLADTTIIAAAPKRMTRAGLGDTLCRSTVEADMLLSHHLLDTPYPRALFDTIRTHEAELIAHAPKAREGDPAFVERLMHALLDAGDAMTAYGSSAPASQGEHMIAHLIDLKFGSELRNLLHGEIVALTTLTVNRMMQKIMLGQPTVKRMPREENQFELLFGKKAGAALSAHYQRKVLSPEQVGSINQKLARDWHHIKTEIVSAMQMPNTIERAFVQSGLGATPEPLGINEERYRFACNYAFMVRDRFTFLDIAAMNDKRVY